MSGNAFWPERQQGFGFLLSFPSRNMFSTSSEQNTHNCCCTDIVPSFEKLFHKGLESLPLFYQTRNRITFNISAVVS